MGYLKEFQKQIDSRDIPKFLKLWEEYCTNDTVDVEEFYSLLKAIKISDMAKPFGKIIETALPIWQLIEDEADSYKILQLIIDLEITNTPLLAEITLEALKKVYSNDPSFNERLRLIGLRDKHNFQGAISNYELLAHLQLGRFVYHQGGWGTGEVVDISPLREHVVIEFENVGGRKDFSFANACKALIPLKDDNFLSRRFANPDLLEKEARENPAAVFHVLLRDLGPKTASEVKDELSELVIPEGDWAKWWQSLRAKLKKDPLIEIPNSLREPFRLRKSEISHEERLQKAMLDKTDINEIINTTYSFVRDTPAALKNIEMKNSLQQKLLAQISDPSLTKEQAFQIYILLESFFSYKTKGNSIEEFVKNEAHIERILNSIDIIAFKKKALVAVREHRADWSTIFLSLLFQAQQSPIRDYLLEELNKGETKKLFENKLEELIRHPEIAPETFIWYFQKLIHKDKQEIPFNNKEGLCLFFESFLILYSYIEMKVEYRDLLKKMYTILSSKRYATVRSIIQDTSIDYIKEILLLVSKCRTFSDHDVKILRSLAEVVHPSLVSAKNKKDRSASEDQILWTTEEGFLKTQDRIRQIGTVEIVDNAREIEAARALGDLRENSEYKFALERRSRLQGELKTLSDQLKQSRILTSNDVSSSEVDVGSIVDVVDTNGKKITYTILGPWDADPDKHILSFQSKFAQAMMGSKRDEIFMFKDEEFKIVGLKGFFDKELSGKNEK